MKKLEKIELYSRLTDNEKKNIKSIVGRTNIDRSNKKLVEQLMRDQLHFRMIPRPKQSKSKTK